MTAAPDEPSPEAAPTAAVPSPQSAPVLAVGAVVFDASSTSPSVLLIRRSRPPSQGAWTLPGGRVEPGEPLSDALRRELLEETGLLVKPGPLVSVVELISETHHYVVLDYACEPEGGVLRAGDDAAEATFVPVEALRSFHVTDAVHDVVERALALRGGSAHETRG